MVAARVFVSMGTPYTEEYSRFRDDLEAFLYNICAVDARIVGKNEYPSGSPLIHIREVMRSCHGVIVVAYERKFLESGIEKRGGDVAQKISQRTYTTPWNHIESSMAYSLGLPLYILCQRGLSEEGLIESKLDWYVQYLEISSAGLREPAVAESLRSWVNTRVLPNSKKPRSLLSTQGLVKFSEMTPDELLKFLGLLAAAFFLGAITSAAFPALGELVRSHLWPL
jgi:hypothetical protein